MRGMRSQLSPLALAFGLSALTAPWQGAAQAQSLTMELPGTPNTTIRVLMYPQVEECKKGFTVPAKKLFRVTDLLISTFNTPLNSSLRNQLLCVGRTTCTSPLTAFLTVPAGSTLSHTFGSGFLLKPGESLFACNRDEGFPAWTVTGYLYNSASAPASASTSSARSASAAETEEYVQPEPGLPPRPPFAQNRRR